MTARTTATLMTYLRDIVVPPLYVAGHLGANVRSSLMGVLARTAQVNPALS